MSNKNDTLSSALDGSQLKAYCSLPVHVMECFMQQTDEGFVILNAARRIIYINDAAMDIFANRLGLAIELDALLVDRMPFHARELFAMHVERAFDGQVRAFEVEYRMQNSQEMHWLSVSAFPIRKEEGDGIQAVALDIHEVTAERQLKKKFEVLQLQRKKEVVGAVIQHMEADRREIATTLHENINQVLTAAKIMLENMPCISKELECYTQRVSSIISASVNELNKLCNNINPDTLNHISLVSLVEDIVHRVSREKNIAIHFDGSGYLDILEKNPAHELTMLRIIQECIYRILTLSNATKVSIVLESLDYNMHVEMVCNDERMQVPELKKDIAILNLYNRSAHYGGSFRMERPSNREFVIVATIPNHGQVDTRVN